MTTVAIAETADTPQGVSLQKPEAVKPTPPKPLKPSVEKAVTHLSQSRFHQSFTLPPNPYLGRPDSIRVTYADVDYRSSSDGPTVFFISGMYGGRWVATGHIDALARKHRLRFIAVDRFGHGGTPNVPLEYRVKGFLDIFPALLDHLGVEHVALGSHSAGTIYLFNILLHFRERLHPRHPYVCFLAPWVYGFHTGAPMINMLKLVPNALIGKSNDIFGYVSNNIVPPVFWGMKVYNFMYTTYNVLSAALAPENAKPQPPASEAHQTVSWIAPDGTIQIPDDPLEYDNKIDYDPHKYAGNEFLEAAMGYLFSENTSGGADDALLCLKRGDNPSWGLMKDYDDAVDNIVTAEKARSILRSKSQYANTAIDQEIGTLQVRAFFSESDHFTGPKGWEWFDNLWSRACRWSGAIEYKGQTVMGSNHDTIADPSFGVVDEAFHQVSSTWYK